MMSFFVRLCSHKYETVIITKKAYKKYTNTCQQPFEHKRCLRTKYRKLRGLYLLTESTMPINLVKITSSKLQLY